jgi:hypothetical protein
VNGFYIARVNEVTILYIRVDCSYEWRQGSQSNRTHIVGKLECDKGIGVHERSVKGVESRGKRKGEERKIRRCQECTRAVTWRERQRGIESKVMRLVSWLAGEEEGWQGRAVWRRHLECKYQQV